MDKSRALSLLSIGISQTQVAAALGVTDSAISQLFADETFVAELAERRFENLRKHNARDDELDALEDTLISQLKRCVPLATRPMEIARILQIINSAKRRGSSAPETLLDSTPTVKLTIPQQVVNNFSLTVNNQVISTGQKDLVTIQSGQMNKLLSNHAALPAPKRIPDFSEADLGFA